MKEDVFESREQFAEHVRKRKQRKRILAFILAITMLLTFAIPISMMFPVQNPHKTIPEKDGLPLYSAEENA